ncbi:MAG: hypothetical protein CM15mP18_4760 [Methanobacteriota archaeon]|nr:MAG: hypothetical protein CM15mP18_4760 [Euryarchaeota archaeon]
MTAPPFFFEASTCRQSEVLAKASSINLPRGRCAGSVRSAVPNLPLDLLEARTCHAMPHRKTTSKQIEQQHSIPEPGRCSSRS